MKDKEFIDEMIHLQQTLKEVNKSFTSLTQLISGVNKRFDRLKNLMGNNFNDLAAVKGSCPFPDSCNQRYTCTKDYCHYDVCSNGHAYRMS